MAAPSSGMMALSMTANCNEAKKARVQALDNVIIFTSVIPFMLFNLTMAPLVGVHQTTRADAVESTLITAIIGHHILSSLRVC